VRLTRPDRVALAAALRRGEPVEWAAGEDQADELVPLCHHAADPAAARWLPPPARPGSGLSVSVVIPAGRHRPVGLDALAAQDVEVETIVLANGRWTEGERVPWEGHGRTRQRGAERARHPWLFFTVDDAIPRGAGFLRTLVEAAEAGGHDAVIARQVPWPDADPVTRARVRAWTPPEGRGLATLDNVAALYRREVLLADPFDPVPIAEDWHWGRRHRVGYCPAAPVLHSHPRPFRALYARTRAIHAERIGAGEAPAVPDLAQLLRALPSVVGPDLRGTAGELFGQYAAARGSRRP